MAKKMLTNFAKASIIDVWQGPESPPIVTE